MAVTKIQARHAALTYSTTAVTYDVAAAIYSETYGSTTSELKNITLTIPETDAEQTLLLGTGPARTLGANTNSPGVTTGVVVATFQNAMLTPKGAGPWMLEGTMVLTGDEQISHDLGITGTATPSSTKRYAVGDIASNNWNRVLVGCVLVNLNNGSEQVAAALTNVWFTKIGTIKPTGADGYFEVDFSLMCKTMDGAMQYKD